MTKDEYISQRLSTFPDSFGAIMKNSFKNLISEVWDAALQSVDDTKKKRSSLPEVDEILEAKTTKGQEYAAQYTEDQGQRFNDFITGFDSAIAYIYNGNKKSKASTTKKRKQTKKQQQQL